MIKALLPDLGGAIKTIIDNKFPDLEETERQRMSDEVRVQLAQLEVNKAEAAHTSIFVAGWRPFLGWACGIVFLLTAGAGLYTMFIDVSPERLDALDHLGDLFTPILLGMLGMGGLRSLEKWRGVARNNLK